MRLSQPDDHETAADLFQKLERMEDGTSHAVSISYNYARAGMTQLSAKWKRIAWERNSELARGRLQPVARRRGKRKRSASCAAR